MKIVTSYIIALRSFSVQYFISQVTAFSSARGWSKKREKKT